MTNLVRYQQPSALTRFQPTTLAEIQSMAQIFYESGLFVGENSTKQSVAALAVKILAGQELGFTPFAAANGMQIIKGKCAPGANLMAAKVKASERYDYRVNKLEDTVAELEFFELGKSVGISRFTAQDAQKAGTQNMGKFPRNMLFARAMSNGVKWYCSNLFNGVAVYTAEELGATVDYETGEVTGLQSDPAVEAEAQHKEVQAPMSIYQAGMTADERARSEIFHTRPAHAPRVVEPEPQPAIKEVEFMDDAPTGEALNIEQLEIDAGRITVYMNNADDCRQWAVENGYTENQYSANTRWVAIVKEQFEGKYTPAKFHDIAKVYVMHYLVKGKALAGVATGK